MSDAPPVVQMADVTIRYPRAGQAAIANCCLTVMPGERVALIGRNGSGKTTLLQAIVGLHDFSGQITVFNHTLGPETIPHIRRQTGYLFSVPEDQLLFPTVGQDVGFVLRQRKLTAAEVDRRVRDILSALDAAELIQKGPYELSHGQRMRVALAGVLISSPSLILLDEPSAGLDPPAVEKLIDYLVQINSTLIIATHHLEFAERVCDRIVLLEAGSIFDHIKTVADVRRFWQLIKT